MRWDTVLFDMDGTLTDSQEGIVKSVSYALERLGRELPPRDTLTAFIGPPLHESFSAICGMDEAETERAVCEFRDYFARRGWAENVPYEGMAEFLAALHAAGLEVDMIAGFRSKEIVILEEEMKAVTDHLYLMTDDGSYGEKGLVTQKLEELIKACLLYTSPSPRDRG